MPAAKSRKKIVFIGAGKLANSLAPAFRSAGFQIIQVFSRTEKSAGELATKLSCSYTTSLKDLYRDADVYIICVKDDAIKKIASSLRLPGKLVVHTSGSTPLKAIDNVSEATGVLYPLQSFTKAKKISLKKVPVFVEGKANVKKLASSISDSVIPVTSEDRQRSHVAAVFACNFTNHLYTIAESLLKGSSVKFSYLYPLILETTKRTEKMSPAQLQTGPAARNDKKTIKRHMDLLKKEDKKLAAIYKALTNDIRNRGKKK